MGKNVMIADNRISIEDMNDPLTVTVGAGFIEQESTWNELNGNRGQDYSNRNEIVFKIKITGTMPAGSEIVVTPLFMKTHGDDYFEGIPQITSPATVTDGIITSRINGVDYLRDADFVKITYRFKQGASEYVVDSIMAQAKNLVHTALGTSTNTSDFVNLFSSDDTDVQKCLQTIDDNYPNNKDVINNPSELPEPVDLGLGLGEAYRIKGGELKIGDGTEFHYPIAPTLDAEELTIICYGKIKWLGTGAFLRTNGNVKWKQLRIEYAEIEGDGTNTPYDLVGTTAETFETFRVQLNNFGSLGVVAAYGTNLHLAASFNNFSGPFLLSHNIVNIFDIAGLNPQNSFYDAIFDIEGNSYSTAITSVQIVVGADNFAFYFNPNYVGLADITRSNVIGAPFKPGSLDQTHPNFIVDNTRGVSESQTVGSCHAERRNTDVTTPSIVGEDGVITGFAEGPGSTTTVTSVTHGRSNGESLMLLNHMYTGIYTISNVTVDTFDISATWIPGTEAEAGTWETGWVPVNTVTVPTENERAAMTDNCTETFYNLELQKASCEALYSVENEIGAVAREWEFCIVKNNVRIPGALGYRELTNKVGSGSLKSVTTLISGDVFQLCARNLTNAESMIMSTLSMIIIKV